LTLPMGFFFHFFKLKISRNLTPKKEILVKFTLEKINLNFFVKK